LTADPAPIRQNFVISCENLNMDPCPIRYMSFKQKPPKYCKEATNTYYVLYSLEHLPIFPGGHTGFTGFLLLSFLTVIFCWAVGISVKMEGDYCLCYTALCVFFCCKYEQIASGWINVPSLCLGLGAWNDKQTLPNLCGTIFETIEKKHSYFKFNCNMSKAKRYNRQLYFQANREWVR